MNLRSLVLRLESKTRDLGEWDSEGRIHVYKGDISEVAEIISKFTRVSAKKVYDDLFALVVFHELYHATQPTHGEKQADKFALATFKLAYKRNPCFPKTHWHRIPR